MFLEISQNSQENTCARVLKPAALLKKTFWYRYFPVNFVKFLRTAFFIEHLAQVAASGTKLMRIQIIPHFKPHCNLEKISLK